MPLSKVVFESLFKRTYPKGIAFAFSYRNPSIPLEEQRKNRPTIFFKHLSGLTFNPQEVNLRATWPIKYEVELGFLINKQGRNIPEDQAMYHVGGYFLLIDFTYTELFEGRKRGDPWCIYKNDENLFPIGPLIEKEKVINPDDLDLELRVNGQVKQKTNTSELIFKVPELISQTSKYVTLNEGDLFLTGTPSGASEIRNNDRIYAQLSQKGEILSELNFNVKLNHN